MSTCYSNISSHRNAYCSRVLRTSTLLPLAIQSKPPSPYRDSAMHFCAWYCPAYSPPPCCHKYHPRRQFIMQARCDILPPERDHLCGTETGNCAPVCAADQIFPAPRIRNFTKQPVGCQATSLGRKESQGLAPLRASDQGSRGIWCPEPRVGPLPDRGVGRRSCSSDLRPTK